MEQRQGAVENLVKPVAGDFWAGRRVFLTGSTGFSHKDMASALSFHLASQLDSSTASSLLLRGVILEAFTSDPSIREAVRADLQAVEDRDSACHELYIPFLYFKGFHALQTYRVAHWLWMNGRESRIALSLWLSAAKLTVNSGFS